MHFYPKITSPWKRLVEKSKTVSIGVYVDKYAEMLSNIMYYATEKIDGTNLNICYDGEHISFQGHTDKTQWAAEVETWINDKFVNDRFETMVEQKFGETNVQFCGELIGPKIQNNLYKLEDYHFIVFDVYFPDKKIWASMETRQSICEDLGLDHVVPVKIIRPTENSHSELIRESTDVVYGGLKFWTDALIDADNRQQYTFKSNINPNREIEGFVVRPKHELYDATGSNRIIYKIKVTDILGREPKNL